MKRTIEERVKVLEKQVKFLRNWIYNVSYPLAPMAAIEELNNYNAIQEKEEKEPQEGE